MSSASSIGKRRVLAARVIAGALATLFSCFGLLNSALAGPWLLPGDPWLKADVQLLADEGIISSPISSWPLSWGDIAQDLNKQRDVKKLKPSVLAAYGRMKRLADAALIVDRPVVEAGVRLAENPQVIRGFADTPRGDQEAWASGEWTGERYAVRVKAAYVADDSVDSKSARLDGSYAALALGNWMVGASLLDRWWGPGWNGSLILSSNARPIPSLVIERNFSTPFETRLLNWLGPWSTSVIWGQLESDRAVPDARFFGWRVNFKPTASLEIGLLRTAQWCGRDRQCDLDAFAKVLVGDSNLDSPGSVDVANQLAGGDIRWASPIGSWPYAVYMQLIGEDEAGGFPSRYLGQLGLEFWGHFNSAGTSWRSYAEFADTTCQFHESSRLFNCAYNNTFYPSGYRFRGRAIGHSSDNDARSFSLGLIVNDVEWGQWSATIRRMELNRAGPLDLANSLTATPVDVTDFEILHRRSFDYFDLNVGLGAERRELASGADESDLRVFLGLSMRL